MGQYEIELADAERDYRAAAATGDVQGAAEASRRIADVRVRAGEYQRMSEQHAANLRGPQYREPTREEIMAMPNEALTPELLRQAGLFDSKFGTVDADDPWFEAGKQWAAATRGQQGR